MSNFSSSTCNETWHLLTLSEDLLEDEEFITNVGRKYVRVRLSEIESYKDFLVCMRSGKEIIVEETLREMDKIFFETNT